MSGQPPTCAGCPLYGKGTGFVLGSGDPKTAKVGLLLEAPGKDELHWKVDPAEISRRKLRYPDMDPQFLTRGMPVVGKAGGILFSWMLAPVQLTRNDLFIDNSLRCLPPKVKGAQYPTGNEKKKAEAWCRQYDRWDEFGPTVNLVQIHPAALAREPSPLPLAIRTFEKAKHFALGGERPLVMCGGKAVGTRIGYGSTVQTWLGHYQPETVLTASMREKRREAGMATKTGPKVKKLTAKTALQLLIGDGHALPVMQAQADGFSEGVCYHVDCHISEEQYKQILDILAPKEKR
jgi:hypothetical protein